MTAFQKKGIFRFTVLSDIPLLVGSILCIGVSSLGAPLETYLYGKIFGKLAHFMGGTYNETQPFLDKIGSLCGQIVIIGAVRMTLSWIGIVGWLLVGERAQVRGRQAVFRYLLSEDLQSLEAQENLVGSLAQTHRCIEEIRAGVSENLGVLIQTCTSIVLLLITSMISLWQLTLVVLASSPLMALSSFCFGVLAVKFSTSENVYSAAASKVLNWCFSSASISRILNGKYFDNAKYCRDVERSAAAFTRSSAAIEANSAVLRTLGAFVFVQGLIFAQHLVTVGSVNIERIFTSFSACLLLGSLIASLADILATINKAQASSKSIDSLGFSGINGEAPARMAPEDHYVGTVSGIMLDKISFHYRDENLPVLREVSAQFNSTGLNFVVGLSGSGKSTLAYIMAGLFCQTSGSVLVNGYELTKSTSEAFVGSTLVNLHSTIFKWLLKENVLVGAEVGKDSDAVVRALRFAGLDEFVASLPNGIDTVLDGSQLSGGQVQKIGLARAYLKDPLVLILDEALSAIDLNSRRGIMRRLRETRKGKLTIIVTHDGQDIDGQDEVLLLDSGSVIATGKADTLRDKLPTKDALLKGKSDSVKVERIESTLPWFDLQTENLVDLEKHAIPDAEISIEPLSLLSVLRFCLVTSDNKLLILFGSVTAIAIGLTPPLLSFLFSRTLSKLFSPSSSGLRSIWLFLVPAIILIPVDGIICFASKMSLSYSLERWIVALRRKCLSIISDQDMTFFLTQHLSANDLTTLLMNDTRDLRNVLSQLVPGVLQMVALSLGGIVWTLISGWKLALAGLSLFFLSLIIAVGYGIVLLGIETEYKSNIAVLEDFCHLSLLGIRTIKSLHLSDKMIREYDAMLSYTLLVGLKRALADGFGESILQLNTSAATAIILYYGVRLVSQGHYSVQQMLLVLTMLMFVIGGLSSLVKSLPTVSRGQRAAYLISKLLAYQPLYLEIGGKLAIGFKEAKSLAIAVNFTDVAFSYPDLSGVRFHCLLRGISFEIRSGESVSLVGPSGSGKSTIGGLLMRLYERDRGSIKVFGRAIEDINADNYRELVTFVPQMPKFFEGTIRENLIYGTNSSHVSDQTITAALQAANVLNIVNKLEHGLDTNCGSNSSFSLGELQRLCIARALVRRPRVIVFDEPTAHLDSMNTEAIVRMIGGGLKSFDLQITVITITHDPQIMRRSARILVVDKGIISQDGSFDQLSSVDGPFKVLLQT